jgi:hypothetical protein
MDPEKREYDYHANKFYLSLLTKRYTDEQRAQRAACWIFMSVTLSFTTLFLLV